MDSTKKSAYRHLLYVAMVAIRNESDLRRYASINPINWHKYYLQSRVTGALAHWLHNLAFFSVLDFERFDEQRFWDEHSKLCSQFPNHRLERYKEIFENFLIGQISIVY